MKGGSRRVSFYRFYYCDNFCCYAYCYNCSSSSSACIMLLLRSSGLYSFMSAEDTSPLNMLLLP